MDLFSHTSAQGETGKDNDRCNARVCVHPVNSFNLHEYEYRSQHSPERFARLGSRVVELARLSDDDWSSADYHNLLEVRALLGVGRLVPGAEDGRFIGLRHCADQATTNRAAIISLGLGSHPGAGGDAQRVGKGGGGCHFPAAFFSVSGRALEVVARKKRGRRHKLLGL